MAIGDEYRSGWASKVAFAEQTNTVSGFMTGLAYIPVTSFKADLERDLKLVEGVNGTRNPMTEFWGVDKATGNIELPMNPANDLCVLLLKHALGGTVSSVAPSAAAAGRVHTLYEGDTLNNAATSSTNHAAISFVSQFGESTSAQWGWVGMKVEQLTLKCEMGNQVKIAADLVGVTGSLTVLSLSLTAASLNAMTFVNVSVIEADNIGSITSGTALKAHSFELTIKNNLKTDDACYGFGSRSLQVIPAGKRELGLKFSMRFDTSTAWSRFLAGTVSALRIKMDTGVTFTAGAGATTYATYIDLPHCIWKAHGIPEMGDDGVYTLDVEVQPKQLQTATSYAIRGIVNNITASY